MNKYCSNFRQKNLNIVIAILRGLKDGDYPSLIARQLGLERNLIHYYVKKLERLDYIKKQESVEGYRVKTRGAITLFHLTQKGSKFLEGIEKRAFSSKVRLHNCYWLYPILRQPEIKIDWRRVELHNWGQLIGRELGLTVRKTQIAWKYLQVFYMVMTRMSFFLRAGMKLIIWLYISNRNF